MELPAELKHYRFMLGGKLEFTLVEGKVLDEKVFSETHVSGGGGGIAVGGVGVMHTRVSSQVNNKREFWVVDDAGLEHSFTEDADKIKLRAGQRLQILAVKNPRHKQTATVFMRNCSTGQTHQVLSAFLLSLVSFREIAMFLMQGIAYCGLIGMVLGGSTISSQPDFAGGLIFLAPWAVYRTMAKMRMKAFHGRLKHFFKGATEEVHVAPRAALKAT